MTRKLFISAILAVATSATVNAGGLMTNTNYHIAFDRMFARGALYPDTAHPADVCCHAVCCLCLDDGDDAQGLSQVA